MPRRWTLTIVSPGPGEAGASMSIRRHAWGFSSCKAFTEMHFTEGDNGNKGKRGLLKTNGALRGDPSRAQVTRRPVHRHLESIDPVRSDGVRRQDRPWTGYVLSYLNFERIAGLA